jgi:hypothetical protein
MNLTNPDQRRALRSIIQAIVALVVIALVAWIIHLLAEQPGPLESIALSLCGIAAMGTLGYIAENVTRAITFKAGIIEAGIGAEEAAHKVADAAVEAADEVKDVKP